MLRERAFEVARKEARPCERRYRSRAVLLPGGQRKVVKDIGTVCHGGFVGDDHRVLKRRGLLHRLPQGGVELAVYTDKGQLAEAEAVKAHLSSLENEALRLPVPL